MSTLPGNLDEHRVRCEQPNDVLVGAVRYAPVKSIWFSGMTLAAIVGGIATFSWSAFAVFLASTGFVLLFGHSLGSHRKLIHDSYQCPKWLEYALVYSGVQVGLADPLGLLRQHELRDYAQRLPDCHAYLRHGSGFWRDAWWQLHCELRLTNSPQIRVESRLSNDRFYRFLERTWMLQQLPPALLLYAVGGWGFVFWGTCARVTAGVFGHWLIGYFAHNHGGMHHEVQGAAVQGRNIPLTSLLTMGECWHNNHHAFPGSARLGLYAGEWDPGWWALVLLRRAGLVKGLRLPEHLAARAELRTIDKVSASSSESDARPPHAEVEIRGLLDMTRQSGLRATLEGPAAVVSPRVFRWIAGPAMGFRHAPESVRLVAHIGDARIVGLPALCVALGLHAGFRRVIAMAFLPVAVFAERLRFATTGT